MTLQEPLQQRSGAPYALEARGPSAKEVFEYRQPSSPTMVCLSPSSRAASYAPLVSQLSYAQSLPSRAYVPSKSKLASGFLASPAVAYAPSAATAVHYRPPTPIVRGPGAYGYKTGLHRFLDMLVRFEPPQPGLETEGGCGFNLLGWKFNFCGHHQRKKYPVICEPRPVYYAHRAAEYPYRAVECPSRADQHPAATLKYPSCAGNYQLNPTGYEGCSEYFDRGSVRYFQPAQPGAYYYYYTQTGLEVAPGAQQLDLLDATAETQAPSFAAPSDTATPSSQLASPRVGPEETQSRLLTMDTIQPSKAVLEARAGGQSQQASFPEGGVAAAGPASTQPSLSFASTREGCVAAA